MPESANEIAYCHACGQPMNVEDVGPFCNVACPHCGKHTRVKREFGSYTLLRRHAIGGMSVVFLAHDNTLDREVAVKILNENYSADSRRIAAFEHEARVTASFSHPHVVRVFTTGRAFNRFFIAMELVPGGHFEDQIQRRGTIPEREMLPLAIQVAEGLRAAHAAGLIHRDIKPGNILLDSGGNAKIVDFGLALLLDPGGTAKAAEIWATPYYVPPEAIEGLTEDFRSDIYAFGATLYHALAGKPPCNEESMATNALREAKKKIIPLEQAAPWITPRTCSVVDRAMAYHPTNRFSSYDELLSYLRDALAQVKAGAKAIVKDPAAAMRRQAAQRRKLILGATGAVITAAALIGGGWWRSRSTAREQSLATGTTQDQGQPTPGQDPATVKRITNLYREAREAVAAGNFTTAQARFTALRNDPAVGEPTRSWAAIEAVLMPMLDGRASDARREAAATAKHLTSATIPDPGMKKLLLPVLQELERPTPIPPTEVRLGGNSANRIMFWMIAGLKNWELGHLAAATPFFVAVKTAQLNSQQDWMVVYQSAAADYLTDFKTLSAPVFATRPADRKGCLQAIAALDAILPTLKTRGRARFNVTSWKLDLEKLSRTTSSTQPPATVRPELPTVLETLAGYAAKCDFATASSYLKTFSQDPPGATRQSLLSLTDAAAAFLRELGMDIKRAPSGVIVEGTLKSGETFNKITSSIQPGKLQVALNGPSRDCTWADLTPESVIGIYRVVIKAETDEVTRYRRHQTAIAFQWLAGDRAQAVATADLIANRDESFRSHWQSIKPGLP